MVRPQDPRVDPSALWRATVESADDAITSIDLDDTITSWNRAAEQLFGYAADEIIGKSNRLIIPPDRYAEEDDIVRRVRGGEGVQHFDTVRVRKDGSRVDVAVTASAILADGDDAVVGVSKIARDISSTKHSERNGARLAAIVESSEDAIIGKDADGVITSWNPAAERMFGFTSEEAVGQSIRTIIPPELQHEEDAILERIRRGEGIRHFETIRCRKDGFCFPISVTVSPIRNAAGVVIGASKIARDISDRKRVEAEAEQRHRQAEFVVRMADALSKTLDYETRLRGLVDLAVPSLADFAALDILQADGRIRRFAVAQTDPSRSQLDDETLSEHKDPSAPFRVRHVIRTEKSSLITDDRDDVMRSFGFLSCIGVPLKSHGINAVLTLATAESGRRYGTEDLRFAEDIASRAALMIENARAYEEIRRASRLKDEFLATLSHELRTPLNAILGYARMLRSGMLSPEKYARTFETIERNTSALAHMVEDILDVSRIVRGNMRLNTQPVELPIVVHDAVATVMPAVQAKHIRLRTAVDPQVGSVSGDPDRLRQVVWNLLSNAVKFTPERGQILVQVERVDSSVEIVVSDSGIGIAPDLLPHVFERFRRGESESGRQHGLGLGLAIVRNLVELHGGTVSAASAGEGQGSTFHVCLPLRNEDFDGLPNGRGEHPREASPPSLAELPDLSGTHVLAVDDDADALGLLREMLEAAGASVTTATSGLAALAIVQADRPDVVVADLNMPSVDGLELLQRIRASNDAGVRGIPAAALTAYARSEDRARALRCGFEIHLAKPVDPAELISVVKALATRRRPEERTDR